MSRSSRVVKVSEMPAERRPRYTATAGVAAFVRSPGDATGLTRMGVHVRTIERGFAGTNRHFHTVEEEWSYVLAGRGTLRIGPLRFAVRAGHFAAFPPGPGPHHFIGESDEPLVILEGGERRPTEDACWYPDVRAFSRGRVRVEPYEDPPPEEADERQLVHIEELPISTIENVRSRALHRQAGLERQAVYWVNIAAGGRSNASRSHLSMDEWAYVLSGRGVVRVDDDSFEIGPDDFIGHPAGSEPHTMEALEELTCLMGRGT